MKKLLVTGCLLLVNGLIPPLKGARGMCLIYWLLVTGYWFQVERNLLCQFIRHCEEPACRQCRERRSNLLITLKNRLLLLLKKQDRKDEQLYLLTILSVPEIS